MGGDAGDGGEGGEGARVTKTGVVALVGVAALMMRGVEVCVIGVKAEGEGELGYGRGG